MTIKPCISNETPTIQCGNFQSPVNIETNYIDNMCDPGEMQLNYDNSFVSIENTGHTIKIYNDESGNAIINGRGFRLEEFHFHTPSEHVVNGHRYSMELHLVHQSQVGRLAALSVFFELGCENPSFQVILDNLNKQKNLVSGIEINIDKLIPNRKTYYHYLGSLTTDPFIENVEWYVFSNPIEISLEQLENFKEYHPCNARELFDLNGRKILKKEYKNSIK
ncbi:carbonic anhydrase family protein [Bacillus wiedmannii]|uniref:carbonic anhydrase family protein n=1 Tax=Bacillus wiedmannii TaxID=1890302 RepID=UPI0015D51FFF|nr:carbonic anhydrase family protein [Bacillus wiedmannii]